MPTTRDIGEFEPTVMDAVDGGDPAMMGGGGYEPDTVQRIAMDEAAAVRRRQRMAYVERMREIETPIADAVKGFCKRAELHQVRRDALDRWDLERTKFRCEDAPQRDTVTGEVIPDTSGAHLRAGVTMGLFTDAVLTAGATMVNALMGNGSSPWMIEPKGNKQENPVKKALAERLLESDLAEADWDQAVRTALRELPRHGTAVMRQSWTEMTDIEADKDGRLREVVRRRGMKIQPWRLDRVYVSHPLRREAWKQATVCFHSMATLSDLECEEKVYVNEVEMKTDPMGMPMIQAWKVERGRYANLDAIRDTEADAMQQDYVGTDRDKASPLDRLMDTTSTDEITSAQRQFDLYELQGQFPIGSLIRAGKIPSWWLEYWDVRLTGPDGALLEGEALARMCDRLTWFVGIAEGATEDGDLIVEFRPCPYQRQRNELLSAVFVPDGTCFYGLSGDAIGHDVGDTADKILNDLVAIADNNADPPKIVRDSVFNHSDNIAKAENHPGSSVHIRDGGEYATGGAVEDTRQAVSYLLKPWDANLGEMLRMLVNVYETRTMVTHVQKGGQGQTGTDTYSELNDQIRLAQDRFRIILEDAAETLILRSVRLHLEDIYWFNDDEALEQKAKVVAGELGLDSGGIFPTGQEPGEGKPGTFAEDFIVRHAGIATMHREVANQFRMNVADAHRDLPTLDREAVLRRAFADLGDDPDEYFLSPQPSKHPRREFDMLMAGDRIQVRLEDDDILHLGMHEQQLVVLRMIDPKHRMIPGLEDHLSAHRDQAQMKLAQAMQMAQAMQAVNGGAPGGAGVPGGGGGGAKGANNPPPGANAMLNGMTAAMASMGPQPAARNAA